MTSEWKVTKNYVGDGYMYAVYRIRDTSATDHSGNREFATDYLEDKDEASAIAAKLNQGEEGGE